MDFLFLLVFAFCFNVIVEEVVGVESQGTHILPNASI